MCCIHLQLHYQTRRCHCRPVKMIQSEGGRFMSCAKTKDCCNYLEFSVRLVLGNISHVATPSTVANKQSSCSLMLRADYFLGYNSLHSAANATATSVVKPICPFLSPCPSWRQVWLAHEPLLRPLPPPSSSSLPLWWRQSAPAVS